MALRQASAERSGSWGAKVGAGLARRGLHLAVPRSVQSTLKAGLSRVGADRPCDRCSRGPCVPWRGDGLPEACELDPARMRQVLTTLVNNAIQFSHPGSPVTLRAHTDGDERNLVFEIIDRGVGISVENQRKLFQPFSQADESMTRRHGGTGLGLCLAARIVEAMGGSIRVESSAGAGARFTVTLPVWALTTSPLVAPRRPDA
jgi:signal transduction histidine kinase